MGRIRHEVRSPMFGPMARGCVPKRRGGTSGFSRRKARPMGRFGGRSTGVAFSIRCPGGDANTVARRSGAGRDAVVSWSWRDPGPDPRRSARRRKGRDGGSERGRVAILYAGEAGRCRASASRAMAGGRWRMDDRAGTGSSGEGRVKGNRNSPRCSSSGPAIRRGAGAGGRIRGSRGQPSAGAALHFGTRNPLAERTYGHLRPDFEGTT